jgi:hypothetical protein
MGVPPVHCSSEPRQLLFMGVFVTAVLAVSYDYVTTAGLSDAGFLTIGGDVLLAILVIFPVLLSDRRQDSG